jgi:hypothetical protein
MTEDFNTHIKEKAESKINLLRKQGLHTLADSLELAILKGTVKVHTQMMGGIWVYDHENNVWHYIMV